MILHGILKETIFMEIPKGMDSNKNECLILKRTIYGLVQSARELNNKVVLCLKCCGFMGSPVDPCLWIKHSEFGIVMVAVYVNSCLVIGSKKGIQDMINCLKNCVDKFGEEVEDLCNYGTHGTP
jgi:Reverse transcriptase (RNA-dependent DNA polymerase)